MRSILSVTAAAVTILFAMPETGLAQAADGYLIGIVLDPTGASVPGCTVTAENGNTGVRWKRETDELGAYRFNNLPVGQFTLSVESYGLRPAILSGIVVALNSATTLNVASELARVQTEVEVTAATAQIDTTSPSIGNSFTSR